MATVFALLGDEVTLYTLQDILESFGHSVVGLVDPALAPSTAHERSYDLYLIDLNLEDSDPGTLVESLKQRERSSRVVVITDYPKATLTLEVLAKGAEVVMRKPYEVGKILRLLEGAP